MKNKFLISIILFFSAHLLFAAPAPPWAIEKTQPDGTKISVFLKGDEWVNWMESADGYTLMYDSLQYVVYAQTDRQGNLTPSNIQFGSGTMPATANITKGLRYSEAQTNTLMQIRGMTQNAATRASNVYLPTTGTVKLLCILVNFSDKAFIKTPAEFDALMNQVGYNAAGAKGSVRDYYLENSYGLLDLQTTIVGPVTLSNTSAYYATRGQEFANEVADLADQLVDFSEFANENDKVGGFHIIYAGHTGTNEQIWPHKGSLGSPVTKDGVELFDYSCSPELRRGLIPSNDITTIGVIAHELGHLFGAGDYYNINNSFRGSGAWDLLGRGNWNDDGHLPAHINPYQKIQFGWITPQVLTTEITVSDMPSTTENPVVYKIMANTDGEHYLLENRQMVGFDTELRGSGLLIWHIAANVAWPYPNDGHPQEVYPVCANSIMAIPNEIPGSYGTIDDPGCPFPGMLGKTEFTDNSIPQTFTWADLGGIGISIKNISEDFYNQTVSFYFCPPVKYFTNQDVTTNTTVTSCKDIYVQNVEVKQGSKLTLDAADTTIIDGYFEVELGAELEIK